MLLFKLNISNCNRKIETEKKCVRESTVLLGPVCAIERHFQRRKNFEFILERKIKSQQKMQSDKNGAMGSMDSKQASLQQQTQQQIAENNESLSYVNLSNHKMDNSELDMGEASDQQHHFSKTATNEFLAVSNQKSAGNAAQSAGGGPYINAAGVMNHNASSGISNILDSQTSSPAVKSDMALRTTAQFTHMQMPPNVNVQEQVAFTGPGKQNRAPVHQQVLAASSALPGHKQTSHLKSASGSTSQTNYISTGGYNSAKTHHKHVSTNLHQTNSAQGRPSEAISRRTTGKLNQNGVVNSGSSDPLNAALGSGTTAARSAVIQTTNHSKSNHANANGAAGREIKKISSKTKGVSEKARKRQGGVVGHIGNNQLAHDSALGLPNEVFGYHHQPSKSQSRHVNRNSNMQGGQGAANNSGGGAIANALIQNLDLQQSTTQNSDGVQNTPHQHANVMFQGGPPMPTGDQYQGFSFMTPIGQQNSFQFMQSAAQNGFTTQQQLAFPMQPQPQVHFIAKQQKFYGISPDRAPLIFKQSSNEKRPYTSSGQMIGKQRASNKGSSSSNTNAMMNHGGGHPHHHANNSNMSAAQSSAIAALYMGSKTHQNGFGVGASSQKRNQSHPMPDDQQIAAAYTMQNFHASKSMASKHSSQLYQQTVGTGAQIYNRKQQQADSNKMTPQTSGFNQKLPEQLQEELLKFKQNANNYKEENMKLKTKIKILENELGRKERTLEEFLQQNQFIQNAQKNQGVTGNTLAPIVQTAQRYQAETYLIMSLKKQVKEQKAEKSKIEEELAVAKKTVKNTKFFEMDQEIKLYKDELIRLRYLLEQAYSPGLGSTTAISEGAPSARPSQYGNFHFNNVPFMMMSTSAQNQSQPAIHHQNNANNNNTFKSTSQTNFFPDTQSNLSHHITKTASQKQQEIQQQQQQYTMGTSDDQISSNTNDILPPLTKNQAAQYQQQMNIQPNPTATQLVMDTRDNEFVEKLTSQLAEKDSLIRKLQAQVDDFSRQRLARLQNATESKGGSAGPVNTKTELARIKKQLKDKEKEILRLKAVENQNRDEVAVTTQDNEQLEKKVKQLQGQISTQNKKTQEIKQELRRKEDQNEKLSQELSQVAENQKKQKESQKQEVSQQEKHLKAQLDELARQHQESNEEKDKLAKQLAETIKVIEEMKTEQVKEAYESTVAKAKVEEADKNEEEELKFDPKSEGELGLIATVLGCRENRDRIEFAEDLRNYIKMLELSKEEREQEYKKRFGLASDYKLTISEGLKNYVRDCKISNLAHAMPKYEFISPSLALIIMQEIRKMLNDPELMEILEEKDTEKRLPFDALRDLCSRFDRNFTDEHCAFITASYLTEIDEGFIYINFQEFLADLKDSKARAELELTGSKHRATSSIGSEGSDSEIRRIMLRAGIQSKSTSRSGAKSKIDEEHMLDIAEAIFVKMSDLMLKKGRNVRGIFTKYSVPEIFPDRTILELLSPAAFLEGIKDTGLGELQEFEVACIMRVLAKPELDNSIILNEFVMIMENFGVMDSPDGDESDDYIPDTEQSVSHQSHTDLALTSNKDEAEDDQKVEEEDATDRSRSTNPKTDEKQKEKGDKKGGPEEEKKDGGKIEDQEEKKQKSSKRKPRQHNLANIDVKGIKILRKVARFLLKQFLHPREFFGKAISKEKIKTKKREFNIDVLKFKDFYLRVKIANIRKRLVENESLNKEICLDWKTHKDLINVKIMVKALEEIAEEEQKALMEEEKQAAEKMSEDKRKDTTIGASDVETPRSEKDASDREQQDDSSSKKKPNNKQEESKKDKPEHPKDSYGIESMKFGNAAIRSKNNGTHSPLLGERQFANLITIEEDKNETQTSNYLENASEREDSKLMSSNQFRGSNFNGMEFEDGDKTSSLQKLSPSNKMLCKSEKQMSASQVASTNEIDQINANVDLPNERNSKENQVGRLTGRASSWKEQQLSKSMAETSINRFKDREEAVEDDDRFQPITPLTAEDKPTDDLPTPKATTENEENRTNDNDQDDKK